MGVGLASESWLVKGFFWGFQEVGHSVMYGPKLNNIFFLKVEFAVVKRQWAVERVHVRDFKISKVLILAPGSMVA
jgi:hypothetical protein